VVGPILSSEGEVQLTKAKAIEERTVKQVEKGSNWVKSHVGEPPPRLLMRKIHSRHLSKHLLPPKSDSQHPHIPVLKADRICPQIPKLHLHLIPHPYILLGQWDSSSHTPQHGYGFIYDNFVERMKTQLRNKRLKGQREDRKYSVNITQDRERGELG
jgi:hypothetical protein